MDGAGNELQLPPFPTLPDPVFENKRTIFMALLRERRSRIFLIKGLAVDYSLQKS